MTTRPEAPLPPSVRADLASPLRRYWLDRAAQHFADTYAGVPLLKFPEDLRVYEHLLWADRSDVVVEIGGQHGGSSLWFRDRLRMMAAYRRIEADPLVVCLDVDQSHARARLAAADPEYTATITLIEGDITDPSAVAEVVRAVPPRRRCLVVEDSAHVYETTTASLRGLSGLVPIGGYFVVEDGCVDIEEMRLASGWPRGVLPAIDDWLASSQGQAFRQRRDLEIYGISCHPFGYLQRVTA